MNYFELLRHRSSVRQFTDQPISEAQLNQILTAANMAPVGSRRYEDIHLTVVRDRAVLDELSLAAARRSASKRVQEEIIISDTATGKKYSQMDPFFAAPAVIFVSHRKQEVQPGIEYCNAACVTLSMQLAAAELGLGSVFLWFALESMRLLPELDRTPLLRLPDGFEPLLGLAVGHPAAPADLRALSTDRLTVNYIG